LKDDDAVFGRVSVVQIASESSAKERAEQYLLQRKRYTDDSGRTDEKFFRAASQTLRGLRNGALRCGITRRAGGAIRIAGVHDHAAHAPSGPAQVVFGDEDGCGDN
jgi:hypothetical protein